MPSCLLFVVADSSVVNVKGKDRAQEFEESSEYYSRFSEAEIMTKQRKIEIMHELVMACVSGFPNGKGLKVTKYGYDARQRVALRLLALWLNIKWSKVVCTFSSLPIRHPLNLVVNLARGLILYCVFSEFMFRPRQ